MEPEKKRHHFVPKAYLKAFCNAQGRLLVYRKDAPEKLLKMTPDAIGFERYYYAQPLPDGGRDTNRLENMFSELEAQWPAVAGCLTRGEPLTFEQVGVLLEFMALQRIRVPASRDVTEAALAETVRNTLHNLHSAGELPSLPTGLNLTELEISIDPHQSIHGMVAQLQGEVMYIMEKAGFWAVTNETAKPFITSDNPVIWFDETEPEETCQPYAVKPDGPFFFIFPVSPTLVVLGAPNHKSVFSRHGLLYSKAPNEDWVAWINEQISKFAYEAVFAQVPGEEEVIRRFAGKSPVLTFTAGGPHLVFGPRASLPKWSAR